MMTAPDTSLATRRGLPDTLRVLVKDYPREIWMAHDNLGAMARFWLQRHDMFREFGSLLLTSVNDFREGHSNEQQFGQFFVPRLRLFLQQLNAHHHIEDEHYFPVFVKAETRLTKGFDLLDSDHHIIHDALHDNADHADAMLQSLKDGRDKALSAADRYADNTQHLISMLLRHLEDEEDLIIPVILDQSEEHLGIS